MIKILMILGGLGKEGITNSVLTYLENLDMTDLDMTLGIAGEADPKSLERARKICVSIHFLPGRNVKPVEYFFALKKLVKQEKYDIVHVHGNSATLAIDMFAAKEGGANVRIAHSRNTSCTHPFMDRLARPFSTICIQMDLLVVKKLVDGYLEIKHLLLCQMERM